MYQQINYNLEAPYLVRKLWARKGPFFEILFRGPKQISATIWSNHIELIQAQKPENKSGSDEINAVKCTSYYTVWGMEWVGNKIWMSRM